MPKSNPHQAALDQLIANNRFLNSDAGRKWQYEEDVKYGRVKPQTASGNVSANGTIGEGTRLQQYTQPTAVPLAAGQQEMITTVRNLLNGSQGNLRQLLSGTPNWGQFESGIAEPMRQSLQNVVQPKVNEAYSGSGTGSSFFSGARQNEQQNQSNALQTELAKLRYQEQQGATANSLQAMGQLTGLNSILSMETANDIDNMARAIATHYQNQGLTAQQAGIDLQNTIQRMNQQNQTFNQGLAAEELGLKALATQSGVQSNKTANALQQYTLDWLLAHPSATPGGVAKGPTYTTTRADFGPSGNWWEV